MADQIFVPQELVKHYLERDKGDPLAALHSACDDIIKLGGLVSAGYVRVNKDGKHVRK